MALLENLSQKASQWCKDLNRWLLNGSVTGSCGGVTLAFLEEVEAFEVLALDLDLGLATFLVTMCFTLGFLGGEEVDLIGLEVILQMVLENMLDMEIHKLHCR